MACNIKLDSYDKHLSLKSMTQILNSRVFCSRTILPYFSETLLKFHKLGHKWQTEMVELGDNLIVMPFLQSTNQQMYK